MVDLTQPTLLGFPITPWFFILCLSVVGVIVFAVLVVSGFSKRESKEREMIENAAKNTSSIPAKSVRLSADSIVDGSGSTEILITDETEQMNSLSVNTETEVLETEVL